MERRPSSCRRESLMCTWKILRPNCVMNAAGSRNWCSKWLGSKLIPNPSRSPIAASARSVVTKSYAISGRMDLERELHPLGLEDVDDRAPALGELLVAALDGVEVGGNE